MSKKQRIVAEFLLQDLERALFLSANGIARELGVSQSTVIRLATDLGFSGYPELQAALRTARPHVASTLQRLETAREQVSPDARPHEIYQAVWSRQMRNMQETLEGLSSEKLEAAADLLMRGRNVYVFGGGAASGLAHYFTFNMRLVRHCVHDLSGSIHGPLQQLMSSGPDDVLLTLGFPRHSYPSIELNELAASRGMKVVVITEGFTSPLVQHATVLLPAAVETISFQYAYAGVLTILDAILTLAVFLYPERARTQLEAWEETAKRYRVYHQTDTQPPWERNEFTLIPPQKRRKRTIFD